jgi:hypothetical protein
VCGVRAITVVRMGKLSSAGCETAPGQLAGERRTAIWGCGIFGYMTKMLKKAVALVERLAETDQEIIGGQILSHVEKLRSVRAAIDAGVRSLDGGEGEELDINDVLSETRQKHEKRR